MNTKKFTIALLASFVVMFLLGGLWHMVILKEWTMQHLGGAGDVGRKEPMMQYIAAGVFILAFFMSYMYPKGVEGDNKLMQGFKFGAMMGVVWFMPLSVIMYGASQVFSGSVVLVNSLYHIVEQGIGGVIIAYVYGSGVKKSG